MTQILTPSSQGVVHSTATRTRLRLPADYRDRAVLRGLEVGLQKIPGVKYAESNERTGSIVIYHEEDPQILENIGDAIRQDNAQLFGVLVAARPIHKNEVGNLMSLLTTGGRSEKREKENERQRQSGSSIKRWVPLAFIVAGVVRMIQTETLLGSMPPLVLFYYAFDFHWKFNEEAQLKKKTEYHQETPEA